MGPRIRREHLESTRQPAAVLRLQTVIIRCAVIGCQRKPVRLGASLATHFTPNQVAARRTDIADRHHVVVVERVLDGKVPLFHGRQPQVRRKTESQHRRKDPVPSAFIERDIQGSVIDQVGGQAETRSK